MDGEGEGSLSCPGEALPDALSLEPERDRFWAGEQDLDSDLLKLLLGDLDCLPAGACEWDFDLYRRDNERDLERFEDLGGERFLLPGELDRLRAPGDLDLDRR